MAFLRSDYVFHDSLRSPTRDAHDSQSCAITRGSVPNDMVAFRSQHSSAGPGFYEQQFATTKYPATKVKLIPREGVTPAWNEEIKNLLSQCRRSHILIEDGPPTLHRFMQEAPSIDLQLLRRMQAIAVQEWQRENTDVFYILRNSINLEGPHNKADLAMLEQKFSCGDLRDGKGLYEFAVGFRTEGSTKAQSQFMRDLDTKLSATASQTQIQVHCDALLATWLSIRGNSIAEPDAFYHYLMESLPLEPESAKVVRLRSWVAEQITEESPALAQPTAFIIKICRHAQLLGITDAVGSLHIQSAGDRRQPSQQDQQSRVMHCNDCDDCDAKCCWSRKRGGRKFCLCTNAKEPMPDDATYGEKQFVSLNRAYKAIQPSANLKKTSVEQMRAAVRKAKVKPAVLPVAGPDKSAPDLSQAQMKLFADWLRSGGIDEQLTMISAGPFEADVVHTAEDFSLLQPCTICLITHSPTNPWCALSLGMPAESPVPERSGGCGRSRCDNGFCACDMRTYDREFEARTRARCRLYADQLVLHDALVHRAASELVDRAVSLALVDFDSTDPVNRDFDALSPSSDPVNSDISALSPSGDIYTSVSSGHLPIVLDSAARLFTSEVRHDSADPVQLSQVTASDGDSVLSPSGGVFTSDTAGRSLIVMDSAERLLTTDVLDDTPTWPAEQVITELSQAARRRLPDLQWQQLTGEKSVSSTAGEFQSVADAFQYGPETESCVSLPVGMTGGLVRAERQPLAGFACGGAHGGASTSLGVEEPTDDFAVTDDDMGTCIGMCDTGHCDSGYRCSMKLKRKRPIVHAPAADLADGTFKRPPLFRKGDAVEFASPERRIRVRTFGTVDSVHHMGAQPYYMVTSVKGTVYSFSEECLRSRGSTDPNFALRGSELVTIGDLTTTHTVLTLDVVEEITEDADDGYADAAAGQDNAEQAAVDAAEELALAQQTVLMTSFEARLQERDAAVQAQLRAQLEAVVVRQELAHERMLQMLSTQSNATDARQQLPADSPRSAAPAASTVDVNPRLAAPLTEFTTPAPREIPIKDLMTSPLQALRSGALAMAGTQRRASFEKVFDLNSSGGTAVSQSPSEQAEEPKPPKSTKPAAAEDKSDESYVAEYYARAQLANAKMVRQYKTRIAELKRSSFPPIAYYVKLIMHNGGKAVGFAVRRLSWAEICLVCLLMQQLMPFARPYLAPALRAMQRRIVGYMQAVQQNSVASLRTAAATSLAAMASAVNNRSASRTQALIEQRAIIAAELSVLRERLWAETQAQAAAVVATSEVATTPAPVPVVMPVGNVGSAIFTVGLQRVDMALCDDGATIDCFLTTDGVVPGTHDSSQGGALTVGDKKSSLASNGVYLYALERCGANSQWQDELFLGHHTPNGVANIMSEAREVNVRKSRVEWCPGMARQFHTKTGINMPLIMGSNGLGFVKIRPITDHTRIVKLLRQSSLTPSWLLQQIGAQSPAVLTSSVPLSVTAERSHILDLDDAPQVHDVDVSELAVTFMPTTVVLSPPAHALECLRLPIPVGVAAPVIARQLEGTSTLQDAFVLAAIGSHGINFDGVAVHVTAASMALSGVGVAGKLPTLAPYDVLVRVHCILGHATLNTVLATIAFATTLPKGFITKEAIQQYIAAKCGICESAKMRRRTFRINLSGISDKTIPQIGKSYVFDTLGLRTPSAQWGYINITRFCDRNPGGIKRSYGHVSMEAATFEALILTMRAYSRPHAGEIHVMKKDGHPSHRSHLIQDLFVDSSMNNHESPPYVHEAINTENSFQFSVPSAMATLAGSGDGEEHFYTAFLYVEQAENRCIHLDGDGKSCEQRFTGRGLDLLASALVFGSPVKYLQHPEVRDSKFDLHALPGRYRGPSRDDESDHRCWVQTGKGATMRHVTVDRGCMRIDERSVLERFNRNHPSHQPMAIDGVPASSGMAPG